MQVVGEQVSAKNLFLFRKHGNYVIFKGHIIGAVDFAVLDHISAADTAQRCHY
jgi:hypothetical protein